MEPNDTEQKYGHVYAMVDERRLEANGTKALAVFPRTFSDVTLDRMAIFSSTRSKIEVHVSVFFRRLVA